MDDIRKLRFAFLFLAAALGLLSAWSNRDSMFPDGISYLDMADAYLHRDWGMAINAYWSPLYSWLLALALLIFKPSMYWESTVVHLVNYFIYLFALISFNFFLKEFLSFQTTNTKTLKAGIICLPNWVWVILGFTLFIWTSLNLITVGKTTPDMLLSGFIYLASGFLLRIKNGNNHIRNLIFLGLTLGLGYLAKTIMFLLSGFYLVLLVFIFNNQKKALSQAMIPLLFFLLVSSPFIYALSNSKGHFTIGDSGKLNYAWLINYVTPFVHWQGECPTSSRFQNILATSQNPFESSKIETLILASQGQDSLPRKNCDYLGKPKHPTLKIYDFPPIFKFGDLIKGTYPPWYDPVYFYEGLKTKFSFSGHIKALFSNLNTYKEIFFKSLEGGLIFVSFLILFLMSMKNQFFKKVIALHLDLFIIGILMLVLVPLFYVEGRYIAPFIVLFYLSIFSGIYLEGFSGSNKLFKAISSLLILVVIINSFTIVKNAFQNPNKLPVHYVVANSLRHIGINEGDKIAHIGISLYAYWARLAKVKIVSEIPMWHKEASNFWSMDEDTLVRVFQAFKETGAKIIVAENVPISALKLGWKQIKNTNFYIYFLTE